MSENDYIAEYVKEKHPQLLQGLDFALWKSVKIIANGVAQFMESLKPVVETINESVDSYPGETEDILKKIKEAGEDE